MTKWGLFCQCSKWFTLKKQIYFNILADWKSKIVNYLKDDEKIIQRIKENFEKYETYSINREDGKPLRIEIKDANENTVVYILYNEVNVNN